MLGSSLYCHEIRFALDYGEDLNQIVKPPEGELFSLFINELRSHEERQRVWQLYQDVGGPKRLDILDPICRRVDAALRPARPPIRSRRSRLIRMRSSLPSGRTPPQNAEDCTGLTLRILGDLRGHFRIDLGRRIDRSHRDHRVLAVPR